MGLRLETFVRRCLPHLSRRECAQAIAEHAFRINGKSAKKGERLNTGDVVSFAGADHWLAQAPVPQSLDLVKLVYDDCDVLAVDKPAGMATHGFSGRHRDTVANVLLGRWPELAGVGGSPWQPGLVNRLDRETSGLVLIARNERAFKRLREQFRRREIRKHYWALVWGESAASGSIGFPLAHDPAQKGRMRVVDTPSNFRLKVWQAHTRFRTRFRAPGMSLLEIEMATGVTHQIRVHLAAVGHPIVGDALYGTARRSSLRRHFLHAHRLEFRHPATGKPVQIDSSLPAELRDYLKNLGFV